MTNTNVITSPIRHHHQLPTLTSGNGNLAYYHAVRTKKLYLEIKGIEETMSKYLTSPKGWAYTVKFMGK
nr:DExH-box ATP-dependent RNA helicase DExH3 isoform X2 [Ipomoea batatas]